MATRAYNGTARPVSDRYELDPAFRKVEWDDADGSIIRGYEEIRTRALVCGACMVVSPSRQTELDAVNAARAAAEAQVATFKASIVSLAQKVRDNTATAAEQRQLLVKLSRAVFGLLSD